MTDQPSPYDPGSKPPRTGVGVDVHDLVKEWRNRATILERQVKDFEAEAFKMCDERNKAEETARNNASQRDAIARQLEEALRVIEVKESTISAFSMENVTLHKRLEEAKQEKLRAQAGQSKSADYWMDRANSLEKDKIEARSEALRLREVLVTIASFDKDRHPQCPHWCSEQAREALKLTAFSPRPPTCREYAYRLGADQARAMGIPFTDEPLEDWRKRTDAAQDSQTRRLAGGIDWPYTRQAAIDRINSQPDPLVADLVAIIDGMMESVKVCERIVQADKDNTTGYTTDVTPDMILAARSAINNAPKRGGKP